LGRLPLVQWLIALSMLIWVGVRVGSRISCQLSNGLRGVTNGDAFGFLCEWIGTR